MPAHPFRKPPPPPAPINKPHEHRRSPQILVFHKALTREARRSGSGQARGSAGRSSDHRQAGAGTEIRSGHALCRVSFACPAVREDSPQPPARAGPRGFVTPCALREPFWPRQARARPHRETAELTVAVPIRFVARRFPAEDNKRVTGLRGIERVGPPRARTSGAQQGLL